MDLPARDALLHDLALFAQVDNIGSLLQPQLTPEQIETLRDRIGATDDLLSHELNERVLHALEQLAVPGAQVSRGGRQPAVHGRRHE